MSREISFQNEAFKAFKTLMKQGKNSTAANSFRNRQENKGKQKTPLVLADICRLVCATQFNHPLPQNHRAFLLEEMGNRNRDHIWTFPKSQPFGLLRSLPVTPTSSTVWVLYLALWLDSHSSHHILPT